MLTYFAIQHTILDIDNNTTRNNTMNITNNFTIGFIGLGLIGGSIAKAIRRVFPSYTIIGYDTDIENLREAYTDGTLAKCSSNVSVDFNDCDYIFLCAPVHYNIDYLPILKKIIKPTTIITDVGSVKSDICKAVEKYKLCEHFIGGHPMVGSESSGYATSNDRLMENAYYFITPSATVSEEHIKDFNTFIEDLGAIPIVYSPTAHDQVTAYISHIPHIIAVNLVNLVKSTDTKDGINKQLAAGGFKDITRIASSSPVVWEHILLSNSDNVIAGLERYTDSIDDVINAIKSQDGDKINELFTSARNYRNSIPDNATGVIRMTYEVYVDIPDEPGAMSKVIVLISDAHINLKNVGITHNREDSEGVLRLSFYKDEDTKSAVSILESQGYKIYKR